MAPLNDEPRKPATLADMFRRAKADVGEPMAYWSFQHAKATGRREIADRQLKRVERELENVLYRASVQFGDAQAEAVLKNAPGPMQFHRLDAELVEATEMVQATENVMAALARKAVK